MNDIDIECDLIIEIFLLLKQPVEPGLHVRVMKDLVWATGAISSSYKDDLELSTKQRKRINAEIRRFADAAHEVDVATGCLSTRAMAEIDGMMALIPQGDEDEKDLSTLEKDCCRTTYNTGGTKRRRLPGRTRFAEKPKRSADR